MNRKEATHQIPRGPKVRVYDMQSSGDRYTVIIDDPAWADNARAPNKPALGLSPGGRAVSQFCECPEGRHLGKLIAFGTLDEETQAHIVRRLADPDTCQCRIPVRVPGSVLCVDCLGNLSEK